MNTSILNRPEDESKELFSLIHIPWKQSERDVWETFKQKVKPTSVIEMKPKTISWKLALAAVAVLFIGIGSFISTYTVNKTTLNAQNANAYLPDGSVVNLNAGSKISYKPYWWWAKRTVKFQGEAFFKVKKGKTFSVESNAGITEVLGTSFNIFSRSNRYEVVCITGKVKVMATASKQSVIIQPKEKAILDKTGQFKVEENINIENSKAWMTGKMIFTSEPLTEVFHEIERQYNVVIILHDDINFEYTGSLDRSEKIEGILQLICRPFELNVITKNNQYHINK